MDRELPNLGIVQWPDPSQITRAPHKNPTLGYIERLFYNAGTAGLIAYLLLKCIIVPSVSAAYDIRCGLSASTLLALRKLAASLLGRLQITPVSALGFNEHSNQIERSTQTSDDIEEELKCKKARWEGLNDSLQDVTTYLQKFNYPIEPSTYMNGFGFRMKLLVDELQARDSSESNRTCAKIITTIREVKGWLVNGRIS